jgi:hypothetical protein
MAAAAASHSRRRRAKRLGALRAPAIVASTRREKDAMTARKKTAKKKKPASRAKTARAKRPAAKRPATKRAEASRGGDDASSGSLRTIAKSFAARLLR